MARLAVPLVAVFVAMSVLVVASPSAAETDAAEWLARSAAHYAAHPELQVPRGSGWKHFTQTRVFLERRTLDGRLPTAAQRVRAWEIGRERRKREGLGGNPTSGDRTARGSAGWFALGPVNISGRIVDLEFHPADPSRMWAASASGGLWLSSDNGVSWRTTTDELPSLAVGAVCVLPTSPDIVLIGTGEGIFWSYVVFGTGIWRSTDAGETWAPTSLTHQIADNHGFHVMKANPFTGTVLAGANDGLWRSSDSGVTWTQVKEGGDYYDVVWKPGSATRVYAAKGSGSAGNNVKVSTDDGLTWTKAGAGQPLSIEVSKTRLATTPADPSVIYAHYGNSQTHGTLGIYRSTDDGATWAARNTLVNISGTQGSYANTIAVAPDDVDRVIAGGIRLWLSTDGGTTFAETGAGNPLGDETSVHSDHHAIAWEPGPAGALWVGTDGGNWKSTDDGDTWSPRRDGLVTVQYYDICVAPSDPGLAIGGSQDNGLPVLEGPDVWALSTLTADGFACHFEPLDPDVIYSEYQFGGRVKSTDGAASWFSIQNGITGSNRPFAPLELDPSQAGRLFTSTMTSVYRTTTAGAWWGPVSPHEATWISVSPVDGQTVWTVDGQSAGSPVRRSTDGGATWSTAAPYGFTVGYATKILAHPTDATGAFVTFSGYGPVPHVARTTDLGSTWQNVSGDFPPEPANTMAVDPADPDHFFVGTDTGVWSTLDTGATWSPLGPSFPNVIVYDLEIHAGARKLVAATYGRGAWEIDLPPAAGTGAPDLSLRHPELLLDPPAPNPVRDRALLRFASRRPGAAVLEIHDVQGRRVVRVAEVAAGDGVIRTASWFPDGVAAGVYFVVLRAGGERLTRKIVVTR